jgi:hypothetical protein
MQPDLLALTFGAILTTLNWIPAVKTFTEVIKQRRVIAAIARIPGGIGFRARIDEVVEIIKREVKKPSVLAATESVLNALNCAANALSAESGGGQDVVDGNFADIGKQAVNVNVARRCTGVALEALNKSGRAVADVTIALTALPDSIELLGGVWDATRSGFSTMLESFPLPSSAKKAIRCGRLTGQPR